MTTDERSDETPGGFPSSGVGSSRADEAQVGFGERSRPDGPSDDTPYLPPSRPVATPDIDEPADIEFDAAAMVAAEKRHVPNPTYGSMPAGTAEGREAARQLRKDANRKRRRNKRIARVVVVLAFAGLAVGGYFAYQALNDDGDDSAAGESTEGSESAAAADDIDQPAADGVDSVIDDASEVVDAVNDRSAAVGDADAAADVAFGDPTQASPRLIVGDVLPLVFDSVATEISEQDGFERYVVDAGAFETANVGAYGRFVEVLRAQPQSETEAFSLFPQLERHEIGLAVQRSDQGLTRVVVLAGDGSLSVDVVQ